MKIEIIEIPEKVFSTTKGLLRVNAKILIHRDNEPSVEMLTVINASQDLSDFVYTFNQLLKNAGCGLRLKEKE